MLDLLQLVRAPIVVLVARGNDVPAAPPDCVLEVSDEPEILGIAYNFERKRRLCRVSIQDREGAITRTVVLNQHFVRKPFLSKDAVQLLREVPLPVIGAKRDAEFHST